MYDIVRRIWEERIPEKWKETIIVPIYKKETEIGGRKKGEQH
jgi:hypothetical protein